MQIVLSQGWVTVDVDCPSQIHRRFTSQVKAKPGIKTNPFAIKSEVDDFIVFSFRVLTLHRYTKEAEDESFRR